MFVNLFISSLIQIFSNSRHKVVLSEQDTHPAIMGPCIIVMCHVKGLTLKCFVYYIDDMSSLNVEFVEFSFV